MVNYQIPANMRKMVESGGQPPPDHHKHTPFALFEWDCCTCRKKINVESAKLMLQNPTKRKEGFKPLILWICSSCYEKICEYYLQEYRQNAQNLVEYERRRELSVGLELPFDDEILEPVPPNDYPNSWFVSSELKQAYLQIRKYVELGVPPEPTEDQLEVVSGISIIDYQCYFTYKVLEINSVYYESSERPVELTPLQFPFDPGQKFIHPYYYIHPMVEDICIYLEDQAHTKGKPILKNITQDECSAPICSAIYNITHNEYRKREKQGTLGKHFCADCLAAEGFNGDVRYRAGFCENNAHSIISDLTMTLGSTVKCHMCAQEESLAYGYRDQRTRVVSYTSYQVLAYGGKEAGGEDDTIVVEILKSGACDNYGVSVTLCNKNDHIPMDEYNTDFGECGLIDCKCFKGKITAQIETLKRLKRYYDIRPLK